MNVKRIVLLALTLPVFLVGCGSADESHGDETTVYPDEYQQIDPPGNGGYPTNIFTVEVDGVKCRVAVVYEAVSMDCEDENITTEEAFE